ncbi:pantoate--beta-alanine ligase [Desertibacillus haloalkaliphilus]|uniref:pantoate--beta-alanine ligase n=1 Tax=Desertibacillus haloalkaliphilus TaxID=1328930 RepID=UPI001C276C9C|nr:pantoate--beta-alanine ligase [Desertibacillus haloalkaliphilus]MBU8907277.1 pantoate--beta-alanine ligase [Desertibacillus haloalkaliphilus]
MRIVESVGEMKTLLKSANQSEQTIGFVATMGFLHDGHISLVEQAKSENDLVVMSIFVNPLQFGPNEDFDRYPRNFERDSKLAKEAGVDVLFYPATSEMYPSEQTVTVSVQSGTNVLCGQSRPGHFDGVATVVLKLFNIIEPDRVYFGMKDAQQVAVIEQMVLNFNLPIEVRRCETVREEDGLAKSSRNVNLAPEERKQAVAIYESLTEAVAMITDGECDPDRIKSFIQDQLLTKTDGVIDYIEVLSYPELKEISEIEGEIIIAIALKFAKARLIDNVTLTV